MIAHHLGTSPGPRASQYEVGYEQAIAQLPCDVRWVTLLAVVEGMSTQEIADLAGVEVDVVAGVLERGQSLAKDVYHRFISESKGGIHGNH